jgi:TrbL/VirB6 plasmid conjugal transfer protein
MNSNFLTIIGNALTQIYAAQAGFFLSTGVSIFWSIVAINIFLLGLDSFSGRLTQERFIRTVGMILIVGSLLGCYATPLPGVGVSFPHLFIDEAKSLSDRLEGSSETLSQDKLDQAVSQIEQPTSGIFPTIGGIVQAGWYLLVIILVGLERLALIGVMAVSYMAIGVIVLVGPLFMPWVLFPGLEHLAWGWFNALLQYCFYQVVAGAVVFLNSTILLGFFNIHPLPWALNDIPVIVLEFIGVVGISIAVVFMVPKIASSVMGGGAVSAVKERGI